MASAANETTAALPAANSPSAQRITPSLCVQLPCEATTDRYAMPAGKWSLSVTFVAAPGPRFVTTISYLTVSPCSAGAGELLWLTAKSIEPGLKQHSASVVVIARLHPAIS